MSKTYTHQTTLKLGSTMPDHVRVRLQEIKREAIARGEEKARKMRALEKAERYETWQEVRLSSLPLKGRR